LSLSIRLQSSAARTKNDSTAAGARREGALSTAQGCLLGLAGSTRGFFPFTGVFFVVSGGCAGGGSPPGLPARRPTGIGARCGGCSTRPPAGASSLDKHEAAPASPIQAASANKACFHYVQFIGRFPQAVRFTDVVVAICSPDLRCQGLRARIQGGACFSSKPPGAERTASAKCSKEGDTCIAPAAELLVAFRV
jgi:hypothetical protein